MHSLYLFRLFAFLSLTTLAFSATSSAKTKTKTKTKKQSTKTVTSMASTTAPNYATYTDPTMLKNTILNSTNVFRDQHNASSLIWNDTLSDVAKDWANQCQWRHSGGDPGENLALGYLNTTAAVDAWGYERKKYNFGKPTGFSEDTGHFTQLVWKNSTTVGCSYKDCSGINKLEGYLLVCEYWPPGNRDIEGTGDQAYKDNVQKQVKGKKGAAGISVTVGATVALWWSMGVAVVALVAVMSIL